MDLVKVGEMRVLDWQKARSSRQHLRDDQGRFQ
jgi:hypothetical protein